MTEETTAKTEQNRKWSTSKIFFVCMLALLLVAAAIALPLYLIKVNAFWAGRVEPGMTYEEVSTELGDCTIDEGKVKYWLSGAKTVAEFEAGKGKMIKVVFTEVAEENELDEEPLVTEVAFLKQGALEPESVGTLDGHTQFAVGEVVAWEKTVYRAEFTNGSLITGYVRDISEAPDFSAVGETHLKFKDSYSDYDVVLDVRDAANIDGDTRSVQFVSERGNVPPVTLKKKTALGALPEPTCEGYVLIGWYTDEARLKEFDVETKIKKNITLYAKWQRSIELGMYPQSLVTQNSIYGALNSGIAEDGSIVVTDGSITLDEATGWYSYNGERYARTESVNVGANDVNHYATGEKIDRNPITKELNRKYFDFYKVEPVAWRVLKETDTDMLIVAASVLDSVAYYDFEADGYSDRKMRNIGGETVYHSNWEHSDVRQFLNGYFYDSAFTETERAKIVTTLVDNSATTSKYDDCANGKNTEDNVFLLSYADLINPEYGFSADYLEEDTARQFVTSPYAEGRGSYRSQSTQYDDVGNWWLRSPSGYGGYASIVYYYGYLSFNHLTTDASIGICPAMVIQK